MVQLVELLSPDDLVLNFGEQLVLLQLQFLDLLRNLREGECGSMRVGRKHGFALIDLAVYIGEVLLDLLVSKQLALPDDWENRVFCCAVHRLSARVLIVSDHSRRRHLLLLVHRLLALLVWQLRLLFC